MKVTACQKTMRNRSNKPKRKSSLMDLVSQGLITATPIPDTVEGLRRAIREPGDSWVKLVFREELKRLTE